MRGMAKDNQRRSLSQWGGPTTLAGESAQAEVFRRCFAVPPPQTLPFTHGFHPYPARMHPSVARLVLRELCTGETVLDPFAGSGTVAVESLLESRRFIGVDVSRVAILVAWARTRVWQEARCRRIESLGILLARRSSNRERDKWPSWAEPVIPWFFPHTLDEILRLREAIDEVESEDERRMLLAVLSSLLVKLSRQHSDSVTRNEQEARRFPERAVFTWFVRRCREVAGMLKELQAEVRRRGKGFHEPDLRVLDGRKLVLPKESIDAVVTSPPYPGHYDYHRQHFLREVVLWKGDHNSAASAGEIGTREGLKDRKDAPALYKKQMRDCMARWVPALRKPARVIVLIGDGVLRNAAIDSARLIREVAEDLGLTWIAAASQPRREWSADRTGDFKREHLLLLEK